MSDIHIPVTLWKFTPVVLIWEPRVQMVFGPLNKSRIFHHRTSTRVLYLSLIDLQKKKFTVEKLIFTFSFSSRIVYNNCVVDWFILQWVPRQWHVEKGSSNQNRLVYTNPWYTQLEQITFVLTCKTCWFSHKYFIVCSKIKYLYVLYLLKLLGIFSVHLILVHMWW